MATINTNQLGSDNKLMEKRKAASSPMLTTNQLTPENKRVEAPAKEPVIEKQEQRRNRPRRR